MPQVLFERSEIYVDVAASVNKILLGLWPKSSWMLSGLMAHKSSYSFSLCLVYSRMCFCITPYSPGLEFMGRPSLPFGISLCKPPVFHRAGWCPHASKIGSYTSRVSWNYFIYQYPEALSAGAVHCRAFENVIKQKFSKHMSKSWGWIARQLKYGTCL